LTTVQPRSLKALDLHTGKLLWERSLEAKAVAPPPLVKREPEPKPLAPPPAPPPDGQPKTIRSAGSPSAPH
jgi:hypothetical protein